MISISNIERFATHDGPGIRTTIFFNGCSLHCPWCANPETWSVNPVLLHDVKKCVECLMCQTHCPSHSIKVTPSFQWNEQTCKRCEICVQYCVSGALELSGKYRSISEILEEVLKDKEYYNASEGGVTISGGECFVQFDGLKQLIKALKKEQLHIALETTGNYEQNKLKEIVNDVDLFLYDIKHVDADKLYETTGGIYEQIVSNLIFLSKVCPAKIIIRVPVIPGFNYEKKVLVQIIQIASNLHIREVDLLPYHNLGKSKWDRLHKKYQLVNLKMMDKEELNSYIEIGRTWNVDVKIGG